MLSAVNTIKEKLPFLIDLSPDDRHALPKMGDKRSGFVQQALEIAEQNPDILPMTKADLLNGLKSGSFKAETFTLDDMKVKIYGDAAVVRAKVTMKGSYQGQTIDEVDQATNMFVKMGSASRQ